ncbi:hypothetical protein CDL12_19894 [Handroanthus impetiginosus]|uniref:Fungal lipase-type domain-containing protein n=1 Tax=Handroanthus impetiginosus TaxID=429701 RepID=A0A2G9GQI2_9LAMI|nr:hypothetical protein CDL12_19894 [Handroanthus impetiginosus]
MMAPPIPAVGIGEFRMNAKPLVPAGQLRNSPWDSIRSSWTGPKNRYEPATASVNETVVVEEKEKYTQREAQNGNWVSKIMLVKSLWKNGAKDDDLVEEGGVKMEEDLNNGAEEDDGCAVDDDDNEEKIEFNRESFSKLLQKVPLKEAKLYAQMSYLGCLAYSISQIKPGNLLKNHGLRFVTSSIEKKQRSIKVEKEKESAEEGKEKLKTEPEAKEIKGNEGEPSERDYTKPNENGISAFAAYELATSAASYLHSHTQSMLRFKSSKLMSNEDIDGSMKNIDMINQDVASLMATDSVTAVVAAKEEVKQAVADDLNSIHSSPCEWFVCDDDQSATRFFVIQGSESLASWKANLLFEPIQFEGLDVLVHRGIYEAAKGIYEQILPEVRRHLKSHGNCAKFRFTGHSLGGSLSLLINLMLLIRGEAPRSSLLPVLTFGSPSIMYGGDRLLRNLRLPGDHIRSITMHRDIVPRVFSCKYPSHIIEFLKAVNGNFRDLPYLNREVHIYCPRGCLSE